MIEKYDPKKIEKEAQKLWEEQKIANKIVDFKKNLAERGKKFYLLDGPPYVNGVAHVGHVKTIVFKDMWARIKFMQGFASWFQPGFDCGGLPIENKVEKELGIKSKQDIEEKVGVDKFIEACQDFAESNKPRWMKLYKQLAAWKAWLEPYMTHKNYYIESGWWTVKQLFEKGLLVEGYKPGFWCPHCETVLSGYEVTDSYKDVQDPSLYIKFPVAGVDNEFIVVWTTTPWTLPANVAVVVHPDEAYVKVKVVEKNGKEDFLILAEKRLEPVMKECGIEQYKIVEKMPGKDLEGLKYLPALDVPVQKNLGEKAHQIILSIPIMKKRVVSKAHIKGEASKEEFGHMVDMDTGSGCVHTAPGHGDVDNKLGRHYGLPKPSPVDSQGKMTEDAGEFAGMFVKDADKKIIEKLRETGVLLHAGVVTHSYPLCWRCKAPLIYRMSKQWFLKIDTLKDKMIKENEKVNWLPEFARERFRNLLIDSPDWAITRQRYWGIPLPIWTCEKCGKKKAIGSLEELKKYSLEKLPSDIDLHKNVVDKVLLKCDCGGRMVREKDVMDVWFDSGISPWASLGYPYKNKELFEKLWPVDLVNESQDQIRGWFYTLMFSSVATFDKKPYDTVCLNGWTLDEKGEKMSKSLGNVIWADETMETLGADVFRLYFCAGLSPWDVQKVSVKEAKQLGRNLNILWNIYQFMRTYANKPSVLGMEKAKLENSKIEDLWLLSRINTLAKELGRHFERFEFHLMGRKLIDFIVNDFSRTYVKLVRKRLSQNNKDLGDKQAAEFVLYDVMEKLLRLLCPITPHITEYIYQDLYGTGSVHLQAWPTADDRIIDTELEKKMTVALEVLTNMNAVRQEKGIKLRWPLSGVSIDCDLDLSELRGIIKELGNVKDVKLKKIDKPMKIFVIGEKDVKISLDTSMSKELEEEAALREVLRKIQSMRKAASLVVTDHIDVHISENAKSLIQKFENVIKERAGVKNIIFGTIEKGEVVTFKDKKITISIEKKV